MSTKEEKRAKITSLVTKVYADLNAAKLDIDTITAIPANSRTETQKHALDDARRYRRVATLMLLTLGLTRDSDVTDDS